MSDLVGNPEDRFSRVEAQIMLIKPTLVNICFFISFVEQQCVYESVFRVHWSFYGSKLRRLLGRFFVESALHY